MSPLPPRWPFLDWPSPIAIAHRGGGAERPENTMAAFGAAVDMGYRYLETDVRSTADGVLLAFHDDTLDRVTDRQGKVSDLSFTEVQRARVEGEPVPRLEEVLGAWPEARVYIDAKDDASVPLLATALDRTSAHDRVSIGSFYDRRVTRLRKATGGRVSTWMGRANIARLRLSGWGLPTAGFHAPSAQVPVRKGAVTIVDHRFLAAARRHDVAVHVWTINGRAEMERLLDLGVGGILSDCPSLLKQVFDERGLWV